MRARGDRLIRAAMTVSVTLVACVAGWLSYKHGTDVVARYGNEDPAATNMFVLTIDGLLVAASLTHLWAARYQLKVPLLARFALVLGISASLSANIFHGLSHGPISGVIAAWPAIALVVSYELLMWLVRRGRELADKTAPSMTPSTTQVLEEVVEPEPTPEPEPVHVPKHRKRRPVPPEQHAAPVNPKPPLDEERIQAAREALKENPKLSGAALGRLVGISDRHGARLAKALRAELAV